MRFHNENRSVTLRPDHAEITGEIRGGVSDQLRTPKRGLMKRESEKGGWPETMELRLLKWLPQDTIHGFFLRSEVYPF